MCFPCFHLTGCRPLLLLIDAVGSFVLSTTQFVHGETRDSYIYVVSQAQKLGNLHFAEYIPHRFAARLPSFLHLHRFHIRRQACCRSCLQSVSRLLLSQMGRSECSLLTLVLLIASDSWISSSRQPRAREPSLTNPSDFRWFLHLLLSLPSRTPCSVWNGALTGALR